MADSKFIPLKTEGVNLDEVDAAKAALIEEKFNSRFIPLGEEPPNLAPTGESSKFVPLDEDNLARESLPETVSIFNPFGENFDTGIPLNEKAAATLVGIGSGMSRSTRGAKQLIDNLGSDEPVKRLSDIFQGHEADQQSRDQAAFRRLTDDPLVGPFATGGEIVGTGLDPALYAVPFAKAKSASQLAIHGAKVSGLLGFLSPVEEGGSRLANTAIGAAGGALTFPLVGQVINRFTQGKFLPLLKPKAPPPLDLPDPFNLLKPRLPRSVVQRSGETLFVNPKGQAGTEAQTFANQFARQPADPPTITQLLTQRKTQGLGGQIGAADPRVLSEVAGTGIGGTVGAITAPEDATPAEVAGRALVGGLIGHQFVRQGGKIVGKLISKSTGKVAPRVGGRPVPKAEPIKTVGDAAEPLFVRGINPQTNKAIAGLAKEFFTKNPGLRDPTRLISDDIQRYVAGGSIPAETLAKHGLNQSTFANIWRAEITEHARALGQLSQVYRQALKSMTPEELGAIKAGGQLLSPSDYVKPLWKNLTDSWRALLVTQPATAVRNAITQAGRVGIDVMQAPMDHWLQRMAGRKVTAQPLDGLEQVFSIFHRNNASADAILKAFPSQRNRMFQRYMSDITAADPARGGFWNSVQKGIDVANILNRWQEFTIRRGIFQATLSQRLRNKGLNLHEIIRGNKMGMIAEDDVAKAVNNALDKTFATTPQFGTVSRKLVDAINSLPGANIAIPFPRFMYNAIKFQYQFSPFGVLSYLSKAERAAFAAGDVSRISKAVIGSGFLGAAMMFRNSEHAGEKWYEAIDEEGNVIDMRPFNPFATYLFAADIIKKSRDGTLHKLTSNDIAQGFLSTNMRAGTGLFLLDKALNLMSKTADEQKFEEKASELSGDFLSGFATPLNAFRDAYDQITLGESIVRDTRQEPFLGPLKSRVPGLSQTLPEAEIPTRAGPSVFKDPFVRQFTGLSIKTPKNAFEKEADRLGFDRREVLPRTGEKTVDRKMAGAMGVAMEAVMVPAVQSKDYQSLTDGEKGFVLSELTGMVRGIVRDAVNEGLTDEELRKQLFKTFSPRLRLLLKEKGIEP